MKFLTKYDKCFIETLNITEDELGDKLVFKSPNWDTTAHMSLITKIERCLDIIFDITDIVEFSSYEKGKEILKKYEVEVA
ncbi:MAG: acyl carrier protein [Clostridiales bacterium]|jgi:acyl carrier protein|nr:acyl carrier protein [Clostridiales bacterium]